MAGSHVWDHVSAQRHPERCKPKAQVGPVLEPPNCEIFLPDACGSRRYLLSYLQ